MHTLLLLLTVASTLVLRSGDRIAVDGPIREEKGVITFRSGGVLYSMPASEIDRIEKLEQTAVSAPVSKPAAEVTPAQKRLPLSEAERKKVLEKLEKNHAGGPPSQKKIQPAPVPTAVEVAERTRDEWAWRREARGYEENLQRAQEELDLLENRVRELQAQIHFFFARGFKPHQFTYQTSELVITQERIPYARLEVERAQRALDQFREDARRQGVLPGWLR